jgi:hypothetical protein
MRFEQAQAWKEKITSYFGTGAYDSELQNDIIAWVRNYSDEDMMKIFQHMKLENKKSYKIDLKALSDAARELGIQRSADVLGSSTLKGERISCEACGEEYLYNRWAPTCSGSGPVCSCPTCGWYRRWTEDWEDAGQPGKDENGTLGPGYHKRVAEWESDLENLKKRCRQSAWADKLEASSNPERRFSA